MKHIDSAAQSAPSLAPARARRVSGLIADGRARAITNARNLLRDNRPTLPKLADGLFQQSTRRTRDRDYRHL